MPLNITFPHAPVLSRLEVDASTTNAPAAIALHRSYEGDLEVRTTSTALVMVDTSLPAEDPSGEGRRWRLTRRKVRAGSILANVCFDADNAHKGLVKIRTSNADAVLSFVN